MTIHHQLGANGLAILALTARGGVGRRAGPRAGPRAGQADLAAPLRSREWAQLARSLAQAGAQPADLLGWGSAEIAASLGTTPTASDDLARLASRASTLALDVERLGSRGIWLLSVGDAAYPGRLLTRLGDLAPPILYGSGALEVLGRGGIAIVGARDADADALAFASAAAAAAAGAGRSVVSGGARGIDVAAMSAAAAAGGLVVGVLAESLERRIRAVEARALIAEERLTLVSPYGADAPFSVGNAMGRNRLIYCLADAAIVVATAEGEGGTWAGATEALAARWVPIYVRVSASAPPGNRALADRGAIPFASDPSATGLLPFAGDDPASLTSPASSVSPAPPKRAAEQQTLFGGDR